MPRFSANLSFLYPELPFLDRIDAAAANGFRGVEYMSPYEYDVAEIKRRLRAGGVAQVLFNLPVGDFAKGERGYATDPSRVKEFRRGVEAAVTIARDLDCTRVNCLTGIAIPGLDPTVARATLVENMRYAAGSLAATGVTLVVEPLNRIETPGFVIGTTAEGLALIDETDSVSAVGTFGRDDRCHACWVLPYGASPRRRLYRAWRRRTKAACSGEARP